MTEQLTPAQWIALRETKLRYSNRKFEVSPYEYWSTLLFKRFRKLARRFGKYIAPKPSSTFLAESSKEVQIKRLEKKIKMYGANHIVRCTDRNFCFAPLSAILREVKGEGELKPEELITGAQWVGETDASQDMVWHLSPAKDY